MKESLRSIANPYRDEGCPVVTTEMIDAAWQAWSASFMASDDVFAAIYRAMRLARPLSDGPGV